MKAGPHPALAQGKVRYVGDHVAVVIAETLNQAKDAVDLIPVDYDVLPAITSTAEARTSPTLVHDDIPGTTVYDWAMGDHAAASTTFPRANPVTRVVLAHNRLWPTALEPTAAPRTSTTGSHGP